MTRIANLHIPLYAVLLAFLLLGGGIFAFAALYLPESSSEPYRLFLPGGGQTIQELEFGSMPALSDMNFFTEVRDKFVAEKTNFIEANLSTMKLTVYEGGAVRKEFPILTKGKEGSWWETPAGLYRIEAKVKNHFSGFAGVHLPWSLPFQGNFFIHGWPYYPSGEPVSSQYSGGCIRLSTSDAEELFGMMSVGTPVLVFEKDFVPDDRAYHWKVPQFDGKGYLAGDLKNNFVFAERGKSDELPVASLTKLMTALVAVEYINIEKEITVTQSAIVPTTLPRLVVGQDISLYNLLPILLMESSNEAAVAISNYLGPQRFVELMNQKAKAIGMQHTRFTDPSGRDAGNVSTPEDLFALARYLYNNRSFILNITRGEIDERVYGPILYQDVKNFNGFRDNEGFVGGKVGLTAAAGETMLALFEMKTADKETRPIAIILLNSPDHFAEAERILSWIRESYY